MLQRATLIVFLLLPKLVHAQTPEEREAHRLYKEAQIDIEASRFTEALEKLDRAYKLFPMPHILVRKAEALRGLGNLDQALDVLRSIQTSDPKLKMKIADLMVAIKRQMQVPVSVKVVTNVPDVEVVVDQVEKYLAPCTIQLTTGTHQFEFKKPGYETLVLDKNISEPGVMEVTLREKTGKVIITTDLSSLDGVIVRIDDMEMVPKGRPGEPHRTEPFEIRAGTHQLLCVREGSRPFMGDFQVHPDRTTVVACLFRPPKSGPPTTTLGYIALGTGGAMTAAGAALVGWYYAKYGQKTKTDALGNRYVLKDYHENIAGFVLIGVGLASAAASYFLLKSDDSPEVLRPSPQRMPFTFAVFPGKGGGAASLSVSY